MELKDEKVLSPSEIDAQIEAIELVHSGGEGSPASLSWQFEYCRFCLLGKNCCHIRNANCRQAFIFHNDRVIAAKEGRLNEKEMKDCPYYTRGKGSENMYCNQNYEMTCTITKLKISYKTSKDNGVLSDLTRFGKSFLESKCTNGDFSQCLEYQKANKGLRAKQE